jgi:hypothetical protein
VGPLFLNKMEKVPTALEVFTKWGNKPYHFKITDVMIDFAQMHVKAALEEAYVHAKLKVINTEESKDKKGLLEAYECGSDVVVLDMDSILNAYPIDEIK